MKRKTILALLLALLFVMMRPTAASAVLEEGVIYSQGYLLYQLSDGGIVIVGYVGDDEEEVVVPNFLAGYPVSVIAAGAFEDAEYLKVIYLPDTIMSIEEGAIPAGISVVRDYNLKTDVTVNPATGTVDPATLPEPSQPTGEIVYQNEETGVTVVDETFLYPVEIIEDELDDDPVPTPSPAPTAKPTPSPAPDPTAAPDVETATEPGNGMLLGSVAAVMLLAALVIVLARRRDKEKNG